jgi:putative transposase
MDAATVGAGLEPGQSIPKRMPIPLSQNMQKTPRRIARRPAWIAHIRAHAVHTLPTDLVDHFDVIAIEDLKLWAGATVVAS